jgi:hypothetical protein
MNIRYYIAIIVTIAFYPIASAASNCKECDCPYTSKSYMAIEPPFQTAAPERMNIFSLYWTYEEAIRDEREHALQIVPFGGKTTNPTELARYFFPSCKTVLVASEPENDVDRDLRVQNFNIYTLNGTFRSLICICPEQTVAGFGFTYQYTHPWCEDSEHGIWASVSFPFVQVRNNINLQEQVIDNGGGPNPSANNVVNANMIEALNQSAWNFGKISPCTLTKNGVADVELKLGYVWFPESPCQANLYLGGIIPTGNKPEAKYLFEPIVGNGQHGAIMIGGGLAFCFEMGCDHAHTLRVACEGQGKYLFSNTQCRSVDLQQKPWGRYLEMYASLDQALMAQSLFFADPDLAANLSTPGINILTLPVDVRPGYFVSITPAVSYTVCEFMIEAGYSFFARGNECVTLACPFKQGPAIKHQLGTGETNPFRTINGNPIIEDIVTNTSITFYAQNQLTEADLDLQSAAQPGYLSHTVFGVLGYVADWDCVGCMAHIGGSYQFSPQTNAAPDRWLVWATFGISC